MSNYYIATDGATRGPYTLEQLRSLWKKGVISPKTCYCEEGGDKWRSLGMMQMLLEQNDLQQRSKSTNMAPFSVPLIIGGVLLLVVIFLIIRAQ